MAEHWLRQRLCRLAIVTPLMAIAGVLEGCDAAFATRHAVGYWRQQPNHLRMNGLVLNATQSWGPSITGSCHSGVPKNLQCSGHGRCEAWQTSSSSQTNATGSLLFCKCFESWAGPECAHPRKSHKTTFILALFLGCLGADKLYLGELALACGKLCSLGGLGVWYLFDLVQYATGPPYTHSGMRVAADLPEWAAMVMLFATLLLWSFALAIGGLMTHRVYHRREEITLRDEFYQVQKERRIALDICLAFEKPGLAGMAADAVTERDAADAISEPATEAPTEPRTLIESDAP
mmetsp:Transcript_12243/g.22664  ORF Transcript_12243/g.22664 Transcript_12243/m.22664 type:complete len:291 (+) Transcript_12243:78-950(+)